MESGPNVTAYVLIIGAMSLMAVGIIVFAYIYNKRQLSHQIDMQQLRIDKNQELLEASFESSEQERKRIAAELHDDINNRLTLLKYGMAGAQMDKDAEAEVYGQIDDTIERIRQISRNLMPPTIERLGLVEALHQLFEDTGNSTGLEVELWLPQGMKFSNPQYELGLYRICQELLNNTIKHAEARKVALKLEQSDGALVFEYTDDGKGMDLKSHKVGVGLRSIESRVEQIRGSYHWDSSPGEGVRLVINCEV
jgi:signal transduction histidine kinase